MKTGASLPCFVIIVIFLKASPGVDGGNLGPSPIQEAESDSANLSDYNYPIGLGNEWWFEGTDWDGAPSMMVYRIEEVYRSLELCPGESPQMPVFSMYCAFGNQRNGGVFGATDEWYDYLSAGNAWGVYGMDDDPGEFELRIQNGAIFADPFQLNIPQSVTENICVNGESIGQATYAVRVLDRTSVTVPAGTFEDCLHIRIERSQIGGESGEVEEQWWARGVGLVKHEGISGDGLNKHQELIAFSLSHPPSTARPWLEIDRDPETRKPVLHANGSSTQQYWLEESSDLENWAKVSLIDQDQAINLEAFPGDYHFFRLSSLYGALTWSQGEEMPVARDQFAGGVIDGKLYLFGGNGNPDGVNLNRLDILDLSSGQWSRGADYNFGIEELSAAVVGGKLYVFGGYAGDGPERINISYDPVTDSWSQIAPKPTLIQTTPVVAWGDVILSVGGYAGDDYGLVTAIEAFDTSNGTWRLVTDLPVELERHAVSVYEDVLYVMGGINRDTEVIYNTIWRFDLKSETWLPEITDALPHPILAVYTSACPVVNGRMLIGGGLATLSGAFSYSNLMEEIVVTDHVLAYDILANKFSPLAPLPEPFEGHLFLRGEDTIYALGGTTAPLGSDERTARMFIGKFTNP